jgi:hypothetical protein
MGARYRVPRTARVTPAGGITPNYFLTKVCHAKFYRHTLLLHIK